MIAMGVEMLNARLGDEVESGKAWVLIGKMLSALSDVRRWMREGKCG